MPTERLNQIAQDIAEKFRATSQIININSKAWSGKKILFGRGRYFEFRKSFSFGLRLFCTQYSE